MLQTREEVRAQLRAYRSQTRMDYAEIAEMVPLAHMTLKQFASGARFGNAMETGETAQRIGAWLAANPVPLPEFPGRIYETAGTRVMRGMIADAREGAWGTVHAPFGAQKTFLFETVFAESARAADGEKNWFALVEAVERMTPRYLLAEIARAIAAPYAQSTKALREAIFYTLRRRSSPVVVVIDEAQLLYPMIDTLECLRRLADLARGRMAVIVAGNEQTLKLFEPRRRNNFGQWRSRIEQRRERVYGPTRAEARAIARQELGALPDAAIDLLVEKSLDKDPLPDEKGGEVTYINLRRLFNAMRDYRRRARKVN